jgi:hypothetical protein
MRALTEQPDRSTLPRARPAMSALTATAWEPQTELELRDWLEHGRRFGALGRGVAWWIGDWLVYGNARYGERYARAARATGYEPQSLMNMVYVASRFPPARRRAALSWSHHAEVAALRPEDQDRWLDLAEQERISVRSLRGELRAVRRAATRRLSEGGAAPQRSAPAVAICPRCRRALEPEPQAAPAFGQLDEAPDP